MRSNAPSVSEHCAGLAGHRERRPTVPPPVHAQTEAQTSNYSSAPLPCPIAENLPLRRAPSGTTAPRVRVVVTDPRTCGEGSCIFAFSETWSRSFARVRETQRGLQQPMLNDRFLPRVRGRRRDTSRQEVTPFSSAQVRERSSRELRNVAQIRLAPALRKPRSRYSQALRLRRFIPARAGDVRSISRCTYHPVIGHGQLVHCVEFGLSMGRRQ